MTMLCPGCYKENAKGYCLVCRKKLFDGHRVPVTLPFDAPGVGNMELYRYNTLHLSIPGAQLKYLLKRVDTSLALSDRAGEYILKPTPAATHLERREETPENEHLTMQIAAQVFDIPTAANALIYFKNGTPAYITRRFDTIPEGGRYQQEDMAQLSGRTSLTHGDNFKYIGTYEEIGLLIRKYVAAYPPALERLFRIVLFNYLFSNGDAHLKNFSVIRATSTDYVLTPAYDLMCTVMHTPLESDTALDLYTGAMDSPFYSSYGYYGYEDFCTFADRIGIMPVRRDKIITALLSSSDKVGQMIGQSFLSDEARSVYSKAYNGKLTRLKQH